MIKQINPEMYLIEKFVKETSKLSKDKSILDVGAGTKPYKKYFTETCYISLDKYGNHDILFDLDDKIMPIFSNSIGLILCTQVLEHVKYPTQVIREFNRILQDKGYLVLTVPLVYGVHSEDNYFNFTKYGIKLLLEENGFKVLRLEARGGVFYSIIYHLHQTTNHITKFKIVHRTLRGLMIPLYFLLYYLDKLDKDKDWTAGYNVLAIKDK